MLTKLHFLSNDEFDVFDTLKMYFHISGLETLSKTAQWIMRLHVLIHDYTFKMTIVNNEQTMTVFSILRFKLTILIVLRWNTMTNMYRIVCVWNDGDVCRIVHVWNDDDLYRIVRVWNDDNLYKMVRVWNDDGTDMFDTMPVFTRLCVFDTMSVFTQLYVFDKMSVFTKLYVFDTMSVFTVVRVWYDVCIYTVVPKPAPKPPPVREKKEKLKSLVEGIITTANRPAPRIWMHNHFKLICHYLRD